MQTPFAGSNENRLRGRRILVVEDEALVAMLIENELLEAGAEILGPKGDVEGALRVIHAAAPGMIDAAVIDLNLHGRSSRPITAALSDRGIPFIIATGYSNGGLEGAPDAPVLCKPFDGTRLVDTLAEVLQREARPCVPQAALGHNGSPS